MTYVWERLPLIILFVTGYLIYRLCSMTLLTDVIVWRLVRLARGRPARLFFWLIAGAATVSAFLPNTVTTLAFLPIVKTIRDDFIDVGADPGEATTVLALLTMYGSNMGGLGTMIGSPANMVFLAALDFFKVPGREQITFANWLIWSIPLFVAYVLGGWLLAGVLAVPSRLKALRLPVPPAERTRMTLRQRGALWLCGGFVAFWMSLGVVQGILRLPQWLESVAALVFGLTFVWVAMVHPVDSDRPLLPAATILQGFPKRGVIFIAAVAALAGLVALTGLGEWLRTTLRQVELAHLPPTWVFFLVTLGAVLLSEIFSNTLVATVMFAVAYGLAVKSGLSPMAMLLAVSTGSTCAYMTPMATTCNSLAFGELKGTSLPIMLAVGLVMNVYTAILFTLWLPVVIPWLYGG